MNKQKNLWISFIAVLISAVLVYGLYLMQKHQLDEQELVAVVVPKRFLTAGETIKANDLELRYLPKAAVSKEMLDTISLAIGKETAAPIGQFEPIVSWRLNHYYLHPRKQESTFQIPKEYVRSISNGIRAGDRVLLYVSGEDEVSRRLFRQSVVVASVKSSGNMEIDNIEQPHLLSLAEGNEEKMYTARRDANAMIEYLNLNLTEEQWLELDTLCRAGTAKLVVAYSPESYPTGQESGENK